MSKVLAMLLCAGLIGGAVAAEEVKRERLQLLPDAPAQKLSGKIKGYDTVEYTIVVPAAGTLELALKSSNSSNYFNVTVPSAEQAMFVGPRDGGQFRSTAQTALSYTVSVYLMRNAARRGERASYVLEAAAR